MSSSVTPLREGHALARHREVISPELALVDPELAAIARASLPASRAACGRSGPRARDQVGDASAQALAELSNAALALDNERGSRTHAGRSWRVLVGVAAVTILTLLLFDVRVQVGRTPASAEAPQPPQAATLSRAPVPPAPRRRTQNGLGGDTAKPRARSFAWAPVEGADAYRVELFRGAERVFSTRVAQSQLTVPASWTFDGERRSLTPGQYKWYVWAIVAGQQVTTAVVQAKLVVS
jgi:hypothetical protein